MKMLYLSTWDYANESSDGVCKKINAHISAFKRRGYEVDFIYIRGDKLLFRENGIEREIAKLGVIKKTPAYAKMYPAIKNKKYDCVYNRYGMSDFFYNRVVKLLKRNGAKIFVEIPSYPYECEREKGFLQWLLFKLDEIHRRKLKKYVSKVITYMEYDEIIGIPTIRLKNGIDTSQIVPIKNDKRDEKAIHLLIVTLMMKHHGYERLIEGMHEYYEKGGGRNIICHFVGDGAERSSYEELVKRYHLEEHILFYGLKGGEELDSFYEFADFGVTAMGLYKDNIFLTSELKVREYLAKGLPLLSGAQVDLFKNNEKWFYYKFSEDATPIDIQKVTEIYDQMCMQYSKGEVVAEIRNFAENTVDMLQTMKPLFEEMEG